MSKTINKFTNQSSAIIIVIIYQGIKNIFTLSEESREILRELILVRMQEKTIDEWMALYLEDGDIAAEPYLYTVEGMQHPQFVHNRHVVELTDPRVGPMKVVGLLAHLSETPGTVGGPAPDLGQHTQQILEYYYSRAEPCRRYALQRPDNPDQNYT